MKPSIELAYRRYIHGLEHLAFVPPLLARLALGFVFVEAGWGKINNLPGTVEFFQKLGIPAAHLQAPFVAIVEILGGVCLLLGFGVRVASLFLAGVMVVAVSTALRADIQNLSDLFSLSEYLFIILLLWLAVHGAGRVSFDSWLSHRSNK